MSLWVGEFGGVSQVDEKLWEAQGRGPRDEHGAPLRDIAFHCLPVLRVVNAEAVNLAAKPCKFTNGLGRGDRGW